MTNERDNDSPEYKAWRYAVFARDQWTCQMTGKKGDIQAHHIVRWADAPHLRYAVSNGITLSEEAHDLVTGREKDFEEQFKRIVAQKMFGGKTRRAKSGPKPFGHPSKKWRPRNPRLRYG